MRRKVSAGDKCPTCGQPVPSTDFHVDLDDNVVHVGKESFKLQPQEAEFLHMLRRAMPRVVHFDKLITGIWGYREPMNPMQSLGTMKYRINSQFNELGYEIVNDYGRGYRLVKRREA